MTHTEIVPEKIPFLAEIAYFSLDISAKAYARIHIDDWRSIQALSKKIMHDAEFSTSGPALNQVIQRLEADNRRFIIKWINTSYFAESSLNRSWSTLDFATGREWVNQYGFTSLDECVELLGTKLYKAINDLSHEMGHQFMLVDEFCTELEEEPLSEWDLMVAGKYDMQSGGWDITNTVSEYCVGMIFRSKLRDIPFTERQIDIINAKIDEYVHSIHPNKPKIDLREVLR